MNSQFEKPHQIHKWGGGGGGRERASVLEEILLSWLDKKKCNTVRPQGMAPFH